MSENEIFEGVTNEEMELFKKLKKKVTEAKKKSKDAVNSLMEKMLSNIDVEEIFNTIDLTGGERISSTIKMEDERKLSISIVRKSASDTDED